ncbi:MAG: hypothetical protein KGV50_02145, partial [Gammaproteobacteria bacterium]|nr:hypothetical protein [Gammaproteobacteria bacterium]
MSRCLMNFKNTKTDVKRMINKLLIILLIVPAITLGQYTGDEQSNSLIEKIKAHNSTIMLLEKQLDYKNHDIDEAIRNLPVAADTIDSQINELKNSVIEERSLIEIQKKLEQLQQLYTNSTQAKVQLMALSDVIKKFTDDTETLSQLRDNPVSTKELSIDQKKQFPVLIEHAQKLIDQYTNQSEKVILDTKKLNQAIGLLNRWYAALSDRLSNTKVRQSVSTSSQLLTKQRDFEKNAEALQAQLDKDRTRLSNSEIMDLQVSIEKMQIQAWLLKQDQVLSDVMSQSIRPSSINETLSLRELKSQLRSANQTVVKLEGIDFSLKKQLAVLEKNNQLTPRYTELITDIQKMQKIISYQINYQKRIPKKISEIFLQKNHSDLLTHNSWVNELSLNNTNRSFFDNVVKISYQSKISVVTLFDKVQDKPLISIIFALISGIATWLLMCLIKYLQKEKLLLTSYNRWIITVLQKVLSTLGALRYWVMSIIFVISLSIVLKLPSPSNNIIHLIAGCSIVVCVGLALLHHEYKLKTLPFRLIANTFISFILLVTSILFYGLALFSLVDTTVLLVSEKILMLLTIIFSLCVYLMIKLRTQREKIDKDEKWYGSYRKLFTFIPLLTAATGLMNIFGYDKLSWLMLRYLGTFILVWIILIVGFTTINHARQQAKLMSIRRYSYGYFIAQ